MINNKRFFNATIVVCFVSVTFTLLYATSSLNFLFASILTDGADAIDVLGQSNYISGSENDGPDTRGMNKPSDVVVDKGDHRLFVADYYNRRVLVYNLDESNNLIDRVADNVLGQVDFITTNRVISQNIMAAPEALAYDNNNKRLFVSETDVNRVMVFDISDGVTDGEAAINVLGQSNFQNANGGTTQSSFMNPTGLTYDDLSQDLYVADYYNNRVMVFDISDGITNGENAVNVLGHDDFVTDMGGTDQTTLWKPKDVQIDPYNKRLFVAEADNNRVTVFDVTAITDGEAATNVLGQANFISSASGTSESTMYTPVGLDFDADSQILFVSEYLNTRVLLFDVSTITDGEAAINLLGQSDFNVSTPDANQSTLYYPQGIDYDSLTKNLYVADKYSNRVLVFDLNVIIDNENAVDVLGQYNGDFSTNYFTSNPNNGGGNSGFDHPQFIEIDSTNHRLFVSDTTNNRILVFNLDASDNLIDKYADFVLGDDNYIKESYDLPINQNALITPGDLVFDEGSEMLYVADTGNARVMVFDLSDGITNGENAKYVLGKPNFFSGNQNISQSDLFNPLGLAIDKVNKLLFVSDTDNNRIMIFDVNSITNGENAVNVIGQTDFVTSNSAVAQDKVFYPQDVLFDSNNQHLFVSELKGNRIMVFDLSDGIVDGENAINVIGVPDFTTVGSNTSTTQSNVYYPMGLDYDNDTDRLFVAASGQSRVLVFDLSDGITDGESAINVIGQQDYNSDYTIGASQNGFNYGSPYGIKYNETSKKLFVSDSNNNRVMIFDAEANIAPTANSLVFVSQAQDQSGLVTMQFNANDFNLDSLKVKVEYSLDDGATWYSPYINSVSALKGSTPSFENGSINNIYTKSIHPYTYNSQDYFLQADPFEIMLYYDASIPGPNYLGIAPGNQNITGIVADPPQDWNLALIYDPVDDEYLTIHFADSHYKTQEDAQVVIDMFTDGQGTVNYWYTHVFEWIDGAYVFNNPSEAVYSTNFDIGEPNIDFSNNFTPVSYQVGNSTGIDTTQGENTVTIVWDTKSQLNEGGAITGTYNNVLFRITPNDGAVDGSAIVSASFTVDNTAFKLVNLHEKLKALNFTDENKDLTVNGEFVETEVIIRDENDKPIGKIKIDFAGASGNIDLTGFIAETDILNLKAFIHDDNWSSDLTERDLYIPSSGIGRVYICPSASLLDDVNPECANKVEIQLYQTVDGMTLTLVVIDAAEYYLVTGITGTGGGEIGGGGSSRHRTTNKDYGRTGTADSEEVIEDDEDQNQQVPEAKVVKVNFINPEIAKKRSRQPNNTTLNEAYYPGSGLPQYINIYNNDPFNKLTK